MAPACEQATGAEFVERLVRSYSHSRLPDGSQSATE